MNQKQKEMQAKLEQIKKNKPQFAGKNTNGMTAVKATKQNQHGAKINAPRKAEFEIYEHSEELTLSFLLKLDFLILTNERRIKCQILNLKT